MSNPLSTPKMAKKSKLLPLLIFGVFILLALFIVPDRITHHYLSKNVYEDKVRGYWIGQISGNFLGRETEGNYVTISNPAQTIYYSPYGGYITGICEPDNYSDCHVNSQTDDDHSIEWVDLWMLETYGLDITNQQIKQSWLDHINTAIWFANRWAYELMAGNWVPSLPSCSSVTSCTPSMELCVTPVPETGCIPPFSGAINYNPFYDYIDSQIEIELFGVIAPGMKNVSSFYSDKFARVTNDDFSVDYAKFYAMMYSEAFFEDDINKIIENVEREFPTESRVHEIITDVQGWYLTYPNWRDTRNRIYNKYYTQEFEQYGQNRPAFTFWVHSTSNFALTIMALLYSQGDFDTGIQISVLAGMDNDCNGATTAGLLGALVGAHDIPNKWKVPIRDFYDNTNRPGLPDDTITNMVQRTVNIGEQIIETNGGIITTTGYQIKRD
jgi:hypothetical protein